MMEQINSITEKDNKSQFQKTSKYFYIEMIATFLITVFLINNEYSDYIYEDEYCSGFLSDCYHKIPHAWRQASMLSLGIVLLISRIYLIKMFSYSIGNSIVTFVSPIILSFYLFWGIDLDGVKIPIAEHVSPDIYLAILLPLLLSIFIDRVLIKKNISNDIISKKWEIFKKIFIPTVLLLIIWKMLLEFTSK